MLHRYESVLFFNKCHEGTVINRDKINIEQQNDRLNKDDRMT